MHHWFEHHYSFFTQVYPCLFLSNFMLGRNDSSLGRILVIYWRFRLMTCSNLRSFFFFRNLMMWQRDWSELWKVLRITFCLSILFEIYLMFTVNSLNWNLNILDHKTWITLHILCKLNEYKLYNCLQNTSINMESIHI